VEQEGHSSRAQQELALLVRQLVAFSRHQAKPAGFLSLNDAILRAEPALRQIAGGAVEMQFILGNVELVTAGEDDLEHLLIDVVSTAASCLPFGGRLTLSTSSETDSTFVLRTTLSVTAAGSGVLPCVTSSSLVRHTARCGGSLRISGEAGRSSTLHVHLPC
jgi:two-component system cell cycle sensor histidine kinase/response regulator CckA